jgi:hypothetical protein
MTLSRAFPSRDLYAMDERIDVCDRRFTRWEKPAAYRASPLVRFSPLPELQSSAPTLDQQFWPLVAVAGRPLDTVSVWLVDFPKGGPNDTPPQFKLQLRLALNALWPGGGLGAADTSSTVLNATVTPPAWGVRDRLFQFSGIVATQWELWGGVVPGGGAGGPSVPITPWFGLVVENIGCCSPTSIAGPFTVIA